MDLARAVTLWIGGHLISLVENPHDICRWIKAPYLGPPCIKIRWSWYHKMGSSRRRKRGWKERTSEFKGKLLMFPAVQDEGCDLFRCKAKSCAQRELIKSWHMLDYPQGPPRGSRGYPKTVLLEQSLLVDELGSWGLRHALPQRRTTCFVRHGDFVPVEVCSYLQ